MIFCQMVRDRSLVSCASWSAASRATGPITFDGRQLIGTVEFVPRPDREHYYVATTGIGPDGVRMQLAWPDLEWWRWEGTVVDFVRASVGLLR